VVSSFNVWNNLSCQHLLEKFKRLMRIVNHGQYDKENRVVHKAYRRTVGTVILKIESVYG
jgi:hypothetical protein